MAEPSVLLSQVITADGILTRKRTGGAAGTYFERDDLRKVLAVARQHSERDWLLILTTVTHGLRVSEAIGLTAGDVRDGHLWVSRLKGSHRTCQPLIGEEKDALSAMSAGLPADGRLFPFTRQHFHRLFRRYCAMAGLDPIASHPHSLKHSCARIVLENSGGDLLKTQKYMGHASITSTTQYVQPTEREACAVAAVALETI